MTHSDPMDSGYRHVLLRWQDEMLGRSPSGRACAPSGLSQSALSQAEPLVPNAVRPSHIALIRIAADYIDGLPMSAISAEILADNLRILALSLEGSADV